MIICNYSHKLHLSHWSLKEKTQGGVCGVFFFLLNWLSRLEKHLPNKVSINILFPQFPFCWSVYRTLLKLFFFIYWQSNNTLLQKMWAIMEKCEQNAVGIWHLKYQMLFLSLLLILMQCRGLKKHQRHNNIRNTVIRDYEQSYVEKWLLL